MEAQPSPPRVTEAEPELKRTCTAVGVCVCVCAQRALRFTGPPRFGVLTHAVIDLDL